MVASTQLDQDEVAAARRLLGVARSAGPAEIRAAFRSAARSHHPDRGGDARQFAAIEQAYRTVLAAAAVQPRRHGPRYGAEFTDTPEPRRGRVISRGDRQRQSASRTFADILASRLR